MSKKQRENKWLEELMYDLWEEYFNDIPRKNLVLIKFGRKAKRQLGCIKWVRKNTRVKSLLKKKKNVRKIQDEKSVSLITITSYFKNKKIPEYVVKATIAHEMIHYAHGFFSPLKQMYKHPHKGGLVRKEMKKRGLETIRKKSKKWLKENWENFIK